MSSSSNISQIISLGFQPPGKLKKLKQSAEPFRLSLKHDPKKSPFPLEGSFAPHTEVYVDLSVYPECVPGLYAGTVVDLDSDLGLYEVSLTTGFVVLVPEEVLEEKKVENWRKTGLSSQLQSDVPVFVSMSGAETYFSAIVQGKVDRDQFEFPTSEMWRVTVQCDDDTVESPLRWIFCRSPVDERFSMDNGPGRKGNISGDFYVGSPVFARPSKAAIDEFITVNSTNDNAAPADTYGRWLAGTVIAIGCHPLLKHPWDNGRYQVKFSFEPMVCYVSAKNIIKRSPDNVAEGEWVPPALGDIVFADDFDSDLAYAARILGIDAKNGYRVTLYFPHLNETRENYRPYMIHQPQLRVPTFCMTAPRAYTETQIAGRRACSLTSLYNMERLLLKCLLEEEGWVYVPQEPVSCSKRSKASGMDSVWRPMGGLKVQYTSNADFSDTVSHLEKTECISDKATIWKILMPFHITPPTWLWEEGKLIDPPLSHLDPDHFVRGSEAHMLLQAAWNDESNKLQRRMRMQGTVPIITEQSTVKPCLPQASKDGASINALKSLTTATLTNDQLLDGLRQDTVWFCKPAGRDYGGGMILGNSIEDCLASPNFDKSDTYVLQPHILRPLLNKNGAKFGVRLYLLIVNEDENRSVLQGYTHTTAGYVAMGVEKRWDPLDTDKKLQLTHTAREYENMLDKWPHYETLFPKMAHQLAILFREASGHLECDSSKRCFELFGCDFVVDEELNPYFLEVNTGPLLNEKQYAMLCDTARIVFYNQPPNSNLWQRLDMLDLTGVVKRANELKVELQALEIREDARFDAMINNVGRQTED